MCSDWYSALYQMQQPAHQEPVYQLDIITRHKCICGSYELIQHFEMCFMHNFVMKPS